MADGAGNGKTTPDASIPPTATPQEQRVLLALVAADQASMDVLLSVLLDIGITGATVLESKGMGAILREEMPIFAGLAPMLPQRTGSRMIFSVATAEIAGAVLRHVREEMPPATRPVAFTVRLDDCVTPGR